MEVIKEEELDIDVKAEATIRKRDNPCSLWEAGEVKVKLWEGEIKVKLQKESREIQVPVQIFHKDDAKNGQKLFDWTSGKRLIQFLITFLKRNLCSILGSSEVGSSGSSVVGSMKYPMALLGSKSKPQLKNLKPFIKVIFPITNPITSFRPPICTQI